MSGIQMSSVVSDVLVELREELELIVPNRVLPERLFNQAQLQICVLSECFQCDIEATLKGYTSETGLTVGTSPTTHNVPTTSVDNNTDDYYNGWLFTNTTREETAWVLDTQEDTPGDGTTLLTLSHAITDQAKADTFKLERLAQYVDLPWYVIRPHFHEGVHWKDQLLGPIALPDLKDKYRRHSTSAQTGTPREYTLENQRLWIYPQPTSLERLYISGHRRPSICIRTTATSNGDSRGHTIISTTIPLKPNDHYQGMEVMMTSGTAQGEIQTIDEYSSNTFYFESPFSAQIDSGDEFEILSPLPEEYRDAVASYMKWKLLWRHKEYAQIASYYENEYRGRLKEMEMIHSRKNTSNARLRKSQRFTRRAVVVTSS